VLGVLVQVHGCAVLRRHELSFLNAFLAEPWGTSVIHVGRRYRVALLLDTARMGSAAATQELIIAAHEGFFVNFSSHEVAVAAAARLSQHLSYDLFKTV